MHGANVINHYACMIQFRWITYPIVYATGYEPMNDWSAKFISPEVAAKIGPSWGLGSNTKKDPGPWEGELRNMWKPTKQAGLWFHGGSLMQARYYSRFLALQIKARIEGIVNTRETLACTLNT